METKALLYGLIGFFIGGFIVAVAATTFEKNEVTAPAGKSMSASMQMSAHTLENKKSDEFDEAFLAEMIMHHQGAIDMARLADKNAEHAEVKELSKNIISAQEREISEMKQWQQDWGYESSGDGMGHMSH